MIRTYAFLLHDSYMKLFVIFSSLTHFCKKNVRRFCNWIYAETPHVVCPILTDAHENFKCFFGIFCLIIPLSLS